MALTVNTNLASINAQRNVGVSNAELGRSLERLSSGLRINRAADDAAGLAIATKLQAQVRGLQQAARNANNAISLVQTAEGALNTSLNILQRLRELAVQSASDDNTASDRATLQAEAQQLVDELTRTANTAEFNGSNLLDGSYSGKAFQIGANYSQTISFNIGDARAKALGTRATLTTNLTDGSNNAINTGNISAGQVTLNGANVVTDSADDSVSVLEIKSHLAAACASLDTGSTFLIVGNGATTATVTIGSYNSSTAASGGSAITGAINTFNTNAALASIVGVKLRGAGSAASSYVVLQATGGRNVTLSATTSGTLLANVLGTELGTVASGYYSSTTTGVTTYNGETSALAKAAAINAVRNASGVSGSVETTKVTGSGAIAAATLSAGEVYINGVDIGAVTVLASDGNGALLSAINAQTSSTGVTAELDTAGKLVLKASDGRNITVDGTAAASTSLGLTFTNAANVQRGQVTLNSKSAFAISGSAVSRLGNDSAGSAITARTVTVSSTNKLTGLDISTQAGASTALLSIDAALDQINSTRSSIGAVQNRVTLAVQTLNIAAENLSASESRIRDADFAFETAKFTRSQILVQAGTAILAQANSTPQIALQLLQR
jgi:flagellin